jgi:phosphoesterase RecJ-like protein
VKLIEKKTVAGLVEWLDTPSDIVLTTHQNPDGDAVGSLLAMYGFLIKKGHHVTPIIPNEFPDFLQWLPGKEAVIDYTKQKERADIMIRQAKIIIFLDYNDYKRGAEMQHVLAAASAFKIMIDHHPAPRLEANVAISVTEAGSTCELVYEVIEALEHHHLIDKNVATCIYTGIMTDTGNFSYSSSRPRTFEVVARLLERGIDKDEISHNVFDNYSEYRMRFLGFCLNEKMQVFHKYHTAFMAITMAEQERFKFNTGDSEGFVNFPLSIKGICFTAFFTERKDKVKISFRSRGNFAANAFAEANFGGGGHLNAAGGESYLPLNETIQKFIDLLPQYEKALNA